MIFNKENKGSSELKALMGFIYASINFDNLKSYIGFAERDLKRIISEEVFDKALAHYNSENYNQPAIEDTEEEDLPEGEHPEYAILDELVKMIQFPVALHAYRRFATSNDIAHSDKGRQIFVGAEEKPAFEWQIEKDNENLINLANEATDVLLEFLDKHIDDKIGEGDEQTNLIPWGDTVQYQSTKELLVNTVNEFEKVYLISGSRVIFLSLIPYLKRVQNSTIKASFTEDRWTEIKESILDKDMSDEIKTLIDLATQPLVLFALSEAIKRLPAEVLPNGIFSNQTAMVVKSKNALPKLDRDAVSVNLERDAQKELRKLQEYLKKLNAAAAGTTYVPDALTDRISPDEKYVRF